MKYFLLIVFFAPVFLQAQQNKNKEGLAASPLLMALSRFEFGEDKQYVGKKVLDTLYYNDTGSKTIKAIGYFAVDKQDKKTEYRVGMWKEFYENGAIKYVGNYNIQYLLVSYSSNTGIIYNEYKTGEWVYYYENVQVKAKGRYKIVRTPVSTGVESQYTKSPVTTDDWVFYNSEGKTLANKKEVIGEVE
ncbi:MAG: hypothetical protein V4685_10170 [Bacteroidota bacterium]